RGQISTQWLGELNAANNIGFPVAPEQELADGTGWIQEFENGTISWSQGENGIYGPTVEVN
ncbi:MAG: hypothetical protein SPK16_01200, partial [Corynebacterium sp.]|nr:hypothetical protein [Corynebacterium sp.]